MNDDTARRHFRILTRTRGGYNGGTMYDVQLQSVATGQLFWAQTFTDYDQATSFERRISDDLEDLPDPDFRRKHGVPSTT